MAGPEQVSRRSQMLPSKRPASSSLFPAPTFGSEYDRLLGNRHPEQEQMEHPITFFASGYAPHCFHPALTA